MSTLVVDAETAGVAAKAIAAEIDNLMVAPIMLSILVEKDTNILSIFFILFIKDSGENGGKVDG